MNDVTAETAADESHKNEVRGIARWLSLGSLIPVIGWAYGVSLLWSDPRLPRRAKVIGTLMFPGGWFGALLVIGKIAWESTRYCYTSSFGEVGASRYVTESGCVQTGAFGPVVGLSLVVVVVLAAAWGPAYVRRVHSLV